MRFTRRRVLAIVAGTAILPIMRSFAEDVVNNNETISDAYVYLLGRALVIRQEQIDSGSSGFAFAANRDVR
jgi:hypothetical protein